MSGGWSSTGCVGPGLLLCLLRFGGALGDTPGSGCRPSEGNWGALSFSWGPADLADATRCTLAGTSSPRCCKAGPVRHMHDHSTRVWHTLSTHAHRGAWHTYEPGTRERGIQMAHANCTHANGTHVHGTCKQHTYTAHVHSTQTAHAHTAHTHVANMRMAQTAHVHSIHAWHMHRPHMEEALPWGPCRPRQFSQPIEQSAAFASTKCSCPEVGVVSRKTLLNCIPFCPGHCCGWERPPPPPTRPTQASSFAWRG